MKNLHEATKESTQRIGKSSATLLSAEQQMKIRGGRPPKPPASKKAGRPK